MNDEVSQLLYSLQLLTRFLLLLGWALIYDADSIACLDAQLDVISILKNWTKLPIEKRMFVSI